MNLQQLITKIEKYNFQNEAGHLVNCAEWKELKGEIRILQFGKGGTSGVGSAFYEGTSVIGKKWKKKVKPDNL